MVSVHLVKGGARTKEIWSVRCWGRPFGHPSEVWDTGIMSVSGPSKGREGKTRSDNVSTTRVSRGTTEV